jgi:hypothetical protein
MPSMFRPSKKYEKIAFDIIGTPSNMNIKTRKRRNGNKQGVNDSGENASFIVNDQGVQTNPLRP